MYQLLFYVPESHVETVKAALFNVGAGKIGDYGCCSWQTLGQGQFKPLQGSNPYIGHQGQLEVVNEYKVEMVCDKALINSAIQALLTAHPYETPAYSVVELKSDF